MAFTKETIASRLVLVVQTGTDEKSGKPILRSRSYNRVDTLATDENVHAVGVALAALQEHPVEAVRRVDDHKLSEQ